MDDDFKMFRKTGEIKYYLKYKEKNKTKDKSYNENNRDKRNSNRIN